jgi:hypothetical protein
MKANIIYRDIELTAEEVEAAYAQEIEDQRWEEFEACERAAVEAALATGAMLNVRRVEGMFEVTLRLKNEERTTFKLLSRLNKGGLFTADGTVIYYPYEFSMQKYKDSINARAATEYVRRKLTKLGN